MKRFRLFQQSLALVLWLPAALMAHANSATDALVCTADRVSDVPPDFAAPGCTRTPLGRVDPQGRLIWVRSQLDAPAARTGDPPLALHVSGKLSGKFFLNGTFVGSNGEPGVDSASETPGRIDAMFHLPPALVRPGRNELTFLASAHRGVVRLDAPLQWLAIEPAVGVNDRLLRRYVPALIALGFTLLAALYFGVSAVLAIDRARSLWLVSACAFAAMQVLAETYRGLVTYAYPTHELRVILICLCAAGFGLSVAGYVFASLGLRRRITLLVALAAFTLAAIAVVKGFDGKTLAAVVVPLLGSLVACATQASRGNRDGWTLGTGLAVFIALTAVFTAIFIDVVFYLLVSAFLLFLFAQQGLSLARERAQRREAAARADRLQLALDQAQEEQSDSRLSVTSAGKVEMIGTAHLVACRSDGGYTELLLDDGRTVLHSATLAEMETTLPGSFLRVHRSYLINSRMVSSLVRDPAGTGTLVMKDGRRIPVSRRTMPAVRLALR
jgi:hypothetical protein